MRPPKQKQPEVKKGLCRVLEHVDVDVDGAISHNRPQIASDRTIHEKSHNSQKDAQNS